MGEFEHDSDSNPESEWDDTWESSWNEFDWERYLQDEGSEVAKYQKLYNKLVRSQNRLDEVALYMGWEVSSKAELPEIPESSDAPDAEQPYTLHKHPLFIASKALHGWLIEKWGQYLALCPDRVNAIEAVQIQQALSQSDYYGLLAVSALDLGDYALSVAYFKRGVNQANHVLSVLQKLEEKDVEILNRFISQARIRIFDLREIWLRVMQDCRAAVANRPEED